MQEDAAAEEVSLSIDETNRLRISLGLKPLNEKQTNAKNAAAEQNFSNERRRQQRRLERNAIIEKATKESKAEKLKYKLEGRGLGDASDGEDDPLLWAARHKASLEKQKKKAAKLAQKKAMEMDEMDGATAYTSADLAGLKVSHDLSNIKDDVLVLADKRILDDGADDDELVSVALAESERLKEKLDNKKGKPGYKGYDDDQFENPGQRPKLLSQYDEVIDGPIRHGFILNSTGSADLEQDEMDVSEKLRENAISLEFEKMQEIKDYYTKEEIANFKKPKKRKKKTRLRQHDTEEDIGNGTESMDLDLRGPIAGSNIDNKIDDVNFVDDDDLQEALSRSRKTAIQKKGPMIDNILNLFDEGMDTEDKGGIILSATSEFVNNLSTENIHKQRLNPAPPIDTVPSERTMTEQDSRDEHIAERDDGRWTESEGLSEGEVEETSVEEASKEVVGALEEEPLVARGLGATVALLAQKGFIEKVSSEQKEREIKQIKKAQWLAEQRVRDKIKEMEKAKEKARNKAKGGKAGGYVDEWKIEEEQKAAERKRMKDIEERFKNYNPDVNIKYTDQFGNNLDTKEAFRYLSHKFHGKYSGKMKTEKRLKKKEEELKLKQMMSTDTPLNTVSALSEKTRTAQTAHVVLSVGNRGLLPPEVSLAESREVEAKKKSGKGKGQAAAAKLEPFITAVEYVDASQAIPSGNREKVAFGLSTKKRNAENAGFDEESLSKKAHKSE
ncbi:hypothetical protein HDU67_008273 [Dinochytrium kinnereticum]|nr:hypothetical protein HDU67_008273 [Dinochytrium kinnereticum]